MPANDMLHVMATNTTKANVFNTLGQLTWTGEVNGKTDINVSGWAKGIYIVRFTEKGNGKQTVKQIVVQ